MGTRWSEGELALLRDVSLSLAEVAARTGRPLHGVENRAYRLGVRRNQPSGIDWSDPDQVRRMKRERYGKGSQGHLRLAGGLSEEEIELLQDTSLTYPQLAERLGWAVRAVEYRAKQLGVGRLPDFDDWTDVELDVLRDLSLTYPEVCQRTGRSYDAVKVKARRLGLHCRRYWSQPGYQPGANDYRGKGWPKIRLDILERDGYTCRDGNEYVPSGRGLVVHHEIPWRLWPENDARFLVTLCRSHHMQRPEHSWIGVPEDILLLLTG